MRKTLAIFGLFVLVGIAAGQNPPPSAPKEWVTKSEGGGKGQEQPNGQPSNQAAPPSVPPSPQPPAPACDEACQNSRKNLQIQNRLVWLTGGLVAVGLLQVLSMIWQAILLRKTRGDVERQADWIETQAGHMKNQNEILRSSVDAAQKSAKAANDQIEMMKQKEEARIQATPLDFDAIDPAEPNKIMMEFVNVGPTNAFDVRVEAGAKVTVEGFRPEQGEYTDLAIPTLLKPDKSESSWVVLDFPRRWQNDIINDRVRITLEVIGQVKYRDVFDTVHTEDFSYRMNVYGIERLPRDFIQLKVMRKWHPFELRPGDWEF